MIGALCVLACRGRSFGCCVVSWWCSSCVICSDTFVEGEMVGYADLIRRRSGFFCPVFGRECGDRSAVCACVVRFE